MGILSKKDKEEGGKEENSKNKNVNPEEEGAGGKKREDEKKEGKVAEKGEGPTTKKKKSKYNFLDLNLVKDQIVNVFDWSGNLLILSAFILSTVLLIIASYFGIQFWENDQKEKIAANYNKKKIELEKDIDYIHEKAKKVFDFNNRSKKVERLLDDHVYWTNLFDYLERNTLKDVYLLNFPQTMSGSCVLQAVAKDYNRIQAQVDKFMEDEYTISASVEGAKSEMLQGEFDSEDVVSFSLNLTFDPSLFKNSYKEKSD